MSRLLKIIPTIQRGVSSAMALESRNATPQKPTSIDTAATAEFDGDNSNNAAVANVDNGGGGGNLVPAVFRIPVLDIVSIRIQIPFVELSTADGPLPPLLCNLILVFLLLN